MFASTTDRDTWASFEVARARAAGGGPDGVGFVFTAGDPFVGVDLDACRDADSGRLTEWADDIVERLNSFTEVSPSGTGVHVLVRGSLPAGRNRRGDVELCETARFFTVTGEHLSGTPTEIESRPDALMAVHGEYVGQDDDSGVQYGTGGGGSSSVDDEVLVGRARAAKNGRMFERLWRGDVSGYASQSEADMALCSLLAFWTGGDAGQMDRLFRESGLLRAKWDTVHFADGSTYGEKTIERAIAGTSEFYEPTGGSADGAAAGGQQVVGLEGVRSREAKRVARIKELEDRLDTVLEEKADLEAALAAERARCAEFEGELASCRSTNDSVFSWFRG